MDNYLPDLEGCRAAAKERYDRCIVALRAAKEEMDRMDRLIKQEKEEQERAAQQAAGQ